MTPPSNAPTTSVRHAEVGPGASGSVLPFAGGSPTPGAGLPRDEVYRQIWRLIRTHRHARHWLDDAVDDAAQDVELYLLEQKLGAIRFKFTRQYFGDPDYETMRKAVFKAINLVYDRARHRHKVELRPGSTHYDEEKARKCPALRQRLELPRDEPLGERDVCDRPDDATLRDLNLDLEAALAKLDPMARALVLRRVGNGTPWSDLAADFDLSQAGARRLYAESLARLTAVLKSYDDGGPSDRV